MKFDLKRTINEDCKLLTEKLNADSGYVYLNECSNSKENGLYQLILDRRELWYGTLNEINAVVKSMLSILIRRDVFPSIKIE